MLFGNTIITVPDERLTFTEYRQFRFPNSKNRRIHKKWSKDDTNFKNFKIYKAVMIGGVIHIPQTAYDTLLKTTKDEL